MLWDLFQQVQISGAQKSANNASLAANIAQVDIEVLQGQIQTLALANHAMWELLSDRLGVTEGELLNKMSEIDLRDGVADGKLTAKAIANCSDCGKPIKRHRPNCYWCGARVSGTFPFIK